MNKLHVAGLVAALTVGITGAGSAQGTADPAVVQAVTSALANTLAANTLHLETQVFTQSSVGDQNAPASRGEVLSFDLQAAADGWNLDGSQTSSTTLPTGARETVTEIVVIDGVTYARLSGGLPGGQAPGGQAADGQASPFLEGWFTLDATSDDSRFGRLDFSSIGNRVVGALQLPVNGDSAVTASALSDDTIDGQTMHVFQITLDPQAVLDSDSSVLLNASGGGLQGAGFGGQGGGPPAGAEGRAPAADGTAPDAGTPRAGFANGADNTAGQPRDAQPELTANDVRLTFAVYVGADDGLIHRLYTVIDVARGGDGVFSQRITSLTDLSAFNSPLTITAPAIGT